MTSAPYRQLYRVTDASELGRLDDTAVDFGLVVGALEKPSVVEEALGRLRFGRQAIGLDWADVRAISQGQHGLAHVVTTDAGVANGLLASRDDLLARGHGAGFVLIEMFSSTDEDRWDL